MLLPEQAGAEQAPGMKRLPVVGRPFFADGQALANRWLRLRELFSDQQGVSQIRQPTCQAGMLVPQQLSAPLDRLAQESLQLGLFALLTENGGQVQASVIRVATILAIHGPDHRQRFPVVGLGLCQEALTMIRTD